MRGLAGLSLLAVLAFPGSAAASGRTDETTYAPHELLVRFEPATTRAERNRALAELGVSVLERSTHPGLVRVRLPAASPVEPTAAALERRPDVRWAEPNHRYEPAATPSDPKYLDNTLWGLNKIHAPEAWDLTTGSTGITVAVVDTGIDHTHPDLAANIWTNPGEIGGDGLDNDGDGYVDDVRGWNFAGGVNPDDDPMDTNGHGTHVAGTIGAVGNNGVGVTGVNWNARVMPLRAGDESLLDFDIAEAFDFACSHGAKVINGSFRSYEHSQVMLDAINRCSGALFVFAAGNETNNNDANPAYPCGDPAENILCVAATATNDTLASFSNWGAMTVDLAAPGQGIYSTYYADAPPTPYATLQGTSMAAPHVAGAAALVLAYRPSLTPIELKRSLVNSVDLVAALQGKVVSGGRLNVFRAMTQELVPPAGLAITGTSPSPGVWTNSGALSVSWGGASDPSGIDGYSFAVSPDPSFVPDEVKEVEENVTSYTTSVPEGTTWFHVRARDGAGNWGAAVHVGPFLVDAFAPPRPTLSSPSHRPGYPSTDHTVEINWITLADSLSGLDGFSYGWAKQSVVPVDQVKDAEEGARQVTSPRLDAGAWWFGIRSRDNAGNWNDTTVLGPFVITNAPPVCSVPRLRGLTLAAAKTRLVRAGCALGPVVRAYSRRVRRGRVIAQRPAPGLRLRRGAKVRVTVSRGRHR
jgi:subtilisin family serine protease